MKPVNHRKRQFKSSACIVLVMNFLQLILPFYHETAERRRHEIYLKFMEMLQALIRLYLYLWAEIPAHISQLATRNSLVWRFYRAEWSGCWICFSHFISISDVIHTDGGFLGIPWVSLEHEDWLDIVFEILSDRPWVMLISTRTVGLLSSRAVYRRSYQKTTFWESLVSSRVIYRN